MPREIREVEKGRSSLRKYLRKLFAANEPAGVLLRAWAIRLSQERRQGSRDRRDQPKAQSAP